MKATPQYVMMQDEAVRLVEFADKIGTREVVRMGIGHAVSRARMVARRNAPSALTRLELHQLIVSQRRMEERE